MTTPEATTKREVPRPVVQWPPADAPKPGEETPPGYWSKALARWLRARRATLRGK